ncbi:thioesterase II family protein [Kitasatospora arboriphila]
MALELPGRVHTSKQRGCRSAAEVTELLLPVLESEVAGHYAVFGHSMGALVAFELVRVLERLGRAPLWLGLSGSPAPETGPPATEQRHTWPHERLVHFMRRLGGTPEGVWHHPVLAERMVRTMRWDLEVVDTYRHPGGHPLTTPVSLFAARPTRSSRPSASAAGAPTSTTPSPSTASPAATSTSSSTPPTSAAASSTTSPPAAPQAPERPSILYDSPPTEATWGRT